MGSLFLAIVGLSSDAVQRIIPAIGRLPFVEDREFRVVAGVVLDRQEARLREAEAEEIQTGETEEVSPVTFEAIRSRVEEYLGEARSIWTELDSRPSPERVGALYDQAVDWQSRVKGTLDSYQLNLAFDFKRGGDYLSPQLDEVHPTDRATLQIAVKRRGQVLRNLLDGTPGKDLAWNERTSIF